MKYGLIVVVIGALLGAGYYLLYRESDAPGFSPQRPPAAGGFGGRAAEAPLVSVTPVHYDDLYDTVDAIGTAQANESVILTAKVTDTVRSVEFEDGDFVEAGAILVQLTDAEEEALLAEARANLDDAESQLKRLEDLAAQGLAPVSDLDVARSRAAASRARLDTVLARLSDHLILAPFSGVLGFRQVSPGTLVTSNTPITTLDDISMIKLDFTVPETFLGVMTPGSNVLARSASYPQREFEGVVRTVGSRVDPVTRAIQVRAHVPNADGALRPGMLLTVRLITAERRSLVVSENSVYQIQDRAFVYVVGADHVARERAIRIGERRFGVVEVLDGLEAGENVVSEGIVKLRDGVKVQLSSEPSGQSRVRGPSAGDVVDYALN